MTKKIFDCVVCQNDRGNRRHLLPHEEDPCINCTQHSNEKPSHFKRLKDKRYWACDDEGRGSYHSNFRDAKSVANVTFIQKDDPNYPDNWAYHLTKVKGKWIKKVNKSNAQLFIEGIK